VNPLRRKLETSGRLMAMIEMNRERKLLGSLTPEEHKSCGTALK